MDDAVVSDDVGLGNLGLAIQDDAVSTVGRDRRAFDRLGGELLSGDLLTGIGLIETTPPVEVENSRPLPCSRRASACSGSYRPLSFRVLNGFNCSTSKRMDRPACCAKRGIARPADAAGTEKFRSCAAAGEADRRPPRTIPIVQHATPCLMHERRQTALIRTRHFVAARHS